MRTGHPVRSAILKHQIGRSVVGWVTTSESLLLYVKFHFEFLTLVSLSLARNVAAFGCGGLSILAGECGHSVSGRANLDLLPNPAVIDYAFISFPRVDFWRWLRLPCDVINHSGQHYKS